MPPETLWFVHIQIENFNGREVIDQEFDRALEALRDTSGLILDIRNNAGGFGHPQIAGRFFKRRTRVGFSYTKKGDRHTDLARREIALEPRRGQRTQSCRADWWCEFSNTYMLTPSTTALWKSSALLNFIPRHRQIQHRTAHQKE